MNEYLGISAICGEEGTGKSSMALRYPKPIFHFDLDVGGFERARTKLEQDNPGIRIKECTAGEDITKLDFSQYDVITKAYPRPINVSKMMGQKTTRKNNTTQDIDIRFPKRVIGVKELWQTFIPDFVLACQKQVQTIILDTSTMMYNMAHNAHLQELQEKQIMQTPSLDENDLREKLLPIEYGPVYDRINQVFHTARSFRINLVLTHYPKDVYADMMNNKGEVVSYNTGKQDLDGYKHTGKLADIIVWLEIMQDPVTKKLQPYAKVHKAGDMPLDAIGEIIPATFEGIQALRQKMMATPLSLADQLAGMKGG